MDYILNLSYVQRDIKARHHHKHTHSMRHTVLEHIYGILSLFHLSTENFIVRVGQSLRLQGGCQKVVEG